MDLVEVYAVFPVVCERRLCLGEDGSEGHGLSVPKVDFATRKRVIGSRERAWLPPHHWVTWACMAPSQTPHRTPLRRVSQGSLLRLSRSGAYPDAPYGLGFLEPALAEFVDETEALQSNVEGLVNLSDSLATFNESFASWLYVMNMNALTTDWPQVRLCPMASISAR
jgi:hypothetical protein